MNEALKQYVDRYTRLEAEVKKLIARKGNSICAQCTCVCCDAVMCVEAIKSPFLKMIHQQEDLYDEKEGFLTPTGCRLEKGRPSVCYEYFCDDHFYFQPDELHEKVLKVIGCLLFHATRNASGETALEDLPTENELDAADFQTLEKNMDESFQALEIIQSYYEDGSMSEENRKRLENIRIPEEFQ